MKKILIDTPVLIEFLRIKKKKTFYEEILADEWRPVVSFITPAELWAGQSVWESKDKAESLETLLKGIEVVLPSLSTLKLSGKLRAKHKISLLDAFIAAAALEEKLPLGTLNTKDFEKIEKLELFRTETLKSD